MPVLSEKIPPYKSPKLNTFNWENWKGGLNVLLKPNEIADNEMAQADNIVLIGLGVPSKRWGTNNYFLSSATASARTTLIDGFYTKTGGNQAIAMTTMGNLVQKSGASYSVITGASFPSGASNSAFGATMQNNYYIANGGDPLTKYDGTTLTRYTAVVAPTAASITATQVSLASIGAFGTFYYKVTATNTVGESLPSAEISVPSISLAGGTIRVQWVGTANATGYQVYGRDSGIERLLNTTTQTTYDDVYTNSAGFIQPAPSITKEPPTVDTTGGPIGKYIIAHQDKLVIAGLTAEPSRVLWSGGGSFVDRFSYEFGGGYVDIAHDDGTIITGIISYLSTIIVFKERSIYQVSLSYDPTVGLVTPTVTLVTKMRGAIAPRSIVAVENDVMFLTRFGVYVLGYEPGIYALVLRTTEVSIKVRPIILNIPVANLSSAAAYYFQNKFFLTYASTTSGMNDKMLIYDRERLCWYGPWTLGANQLNTYYDSANGEHLLLADSGDNYVNDFSPSFTSDNGTAIATDFSSKVYSMGDWTLFKTLKNMFYRFRNVQGTANLNLYTEGIAGTVIVADSKSVTGNIGNSGFGVDQMGMTQMGLTNAKPANLSTETIKRSILNKVARTAWVEIRTSNVADYYELLALGGDYTVLSPGVRPSSWTT